MRVEVLNIGIAMANGAIGIGRHALLNLTEA